MSDRKPWMKWYPQDWLGDPALRSCSPAARGVWADLIALAHQATPYGHILINGNAPDVGKLARLIGITADECESLIDELESNGVFSRTRHGTIYCRRMIRDHKRSIDGQKWKNKGISQTADIQQEITGPTRDPSRPPTRGTRARAFHMPEARSQKEEKETRVSHAKEACSSTSTLFAELPESSPSSQPPAVRPSKNNGLELEAVAVYRELCVPAGLPDIRGLSPESRQITLGKRLREDFAGDIRQWRDFCERVGASPLLTGEVKSWRANFDWILKPANMVKILEGAYEDRAPPERRSRNPQAKDLRYD